MDFSLPGTLKVICYYNTWLASADKEKYFPIFDEAQYLDDNIARSAAINFVMRLCSPPLLCITFRIIQLAADPHITITMLLFAA